MWLVRIAVYCKELVGVAGGSILAVSKIDNPTSVKTL